MSFLPSVLMIGCGKMGGALFSRWCAKGLSPSIVIDHHKPTFEAPHQSLENLSELPPSFQPDFIILAVKPDKAETVLKDLPAHLKTLPLISVLAGRSTAFLNSLLTPQTPVIRIMPNTPSLVGAGMSVGFAGTYVSKEQKGQCTRLFEIAGKVAWIDKEEDMHSVTALSGCGPAYVFLLTELMGDLGEKYGLSREFANLLARQTIYGSGALLAASSLDAATLRKQVTSPNGVTERALLVLMEEKGLRNLLDRALQAAQKRSEELSE